MVGKIVKTTLLKNKVLCIEFKNPKKFNALSTDMLNELNLLFEKKIFLTKFSFIIFKGFNNGPFSSGADLSEIHIKNKLIKYQNLLEKVLSKMKIVKVPKVSFINGYCYGAGFLIAMHTDITISNKNSEFMLPLIKMNAKISKKLMQYLFSKNINNFFLREILISGRKFSAKDAYAANMISILIKKDFINACNNYISNVVKYDKSILHYIIKSTI